MSATGPVVSKKALKDVEDRQNDPLQQADHLLDSVKTQEDIERVYALFRWVHEGI